MQHYLLAMDGIPKSRIPENLNEILWGGWIYPECGCKKDGIKGKPVADTIQ